MTRLLLGDIRGSTRSEPMTYAVIQTSETFKILNTRSMCAYGSFDSREEAEQAIAESAKADQLARCGQ